jgi:hypothetical protein
MYDNQNRQIERIRDRDLEVKFIESRLEKSRKECENALNEQIELKT